MSASSRVLALLNRTMEPLLTSRLITTLVGVEPVRIRYTGRRSGRLIETPVWCKPTADGVRIQVGGAAQKSWWRNFREAAQPIDVLRRGAWYPGLGVARETSGKVFVDVTWRT